MRIPYIKNLEKMSFAELDLAMETGAAKSFLDCLNWKDEFPYKPDVAFSIAHSDSHIAVLYHVRGLDLRAVATEDNAAVCKDSCCEFFVQHPSDGTYCNFELNCIGTLLAARRTGRHDPAHFTPEQLSRVIRHTTLERKTCEINGKIFEWSVAMCIPMDLMGLDPAALPATIRANFYKCADLSGHPHFVSWAPISTPQPDFHRPEFFKELSF